MPLLTHSQLIVFKHPKLSTAGFEDRKNRRGKKGMETNLKDLTATGMQILTLKVFARA